MISANPEYGVKHCLPMTFEPDPAMRVVFAHVFARVVGRGLKFETPDIQPPTNKQSKLCEVRSLSTSSGVATDCAFDSQLVKASDVKSPLFMLCTRLTLILARFGFGDL